MNNIKVHDELSLRDWLLLGIPSWPQIHGRSSCFRLPSAEIPGMCHHAKLKPIILCNDYNLGRKQFVAVLHATVRVASLATSGVRALPLPNLPISSSAQNVLGKKPRWQDGGTLPLLVLAVKQIRACCRNSRLLASMRFSGA